MHPAVQAKDHETERARWSLKVSHDKDAALRTLLATRGGRKGDLSRFVEDVVNREVLRQTTQNVRARNAARNEAEVLLLVEDELGAIRLEAGSHAPP